MTDYILDLAKRLQIQRHEVPGAETVDWSSMPPDEAEVLARRMYDGPEEDETCVPGGEVGGPCPDEWQPADHEAPDAPKARPGSMQDWVGEI